MQRGHPEVTAELADDELLELVAFVVSGRPTKTTMPSSLRRTTCVRTRPASDSPVSLTTNCRPSQLLELARPRRTRGSGSSSRPPMPAPRVRFTASAAVPGDQPDAVGVVLQEPVLVELQLDDPPATIAYGVGRQRTCGSIPPSAPALPSRSVCGRRRSRRTSAPAPRPTGCSRSWAGICTSASRSRSSAALLPACVRRWRVAVDSVPDVARGDGADDDVPGPGRGRVDVGQVVERERGGLGVAGR